MKLTPLRGVRASATAAHATSGYPPRRATRLLDRLPRLVASGAAACALALLSCTASEGDGFQCGTPLPGEENTIRQCDVVHQACICATNSCAETVAATECDTGFRYVDGPFARSDVRGKCVTAPPGDWLVKAGAGNVACRNEADGGGGGASSTSSSTSSASSSSSSGTGTSSSSGGGTSP